MGDRVRVNETQCSPTEYISKKYCCTAVQKAVLDKLYKV